MTFRSLKMLLAALVTLGFCFQSNAAVVYQYGFENLVHIDSTTPTPWTGTPDILATGLSASSWATNYTGGLFISYGGSCGNTTCKALSISHNNYPASTTYTLSFTINSGYALNVTDLSFWNRSSNTGPTTANITINGTTAVSNITLAGNSGGNTGVLTPATAFNNLTGAFTMVITLTGSTGTAGTFRLDDFIIDGTVTSTSGINAYTVTGGGHYCAGDSGVHIGLAQSDTGISYQLKNGTNNVGAPLAGTGAALNFGLFTAAGNYTVLATNHAAATNTMTGNAIIVIDTLPVVNLGTHAAQCGGVVLLDAGNAGSTYSWSDNSSVETDVTTASGTYIVTVTNTNHCSASASAVVTINTPPSLAFSITNANICAGLSTTISATGANTYLWSNGSTTADITVSPSANTVYTVTGTDNNNCTATGASSVNVAPAITSSITTQICQGITYSGHAATGVFVDTFTTSGGCDSIRTLNLTVTPAIVTTASQTICAGQSYNGHSTAGTFSDTLTTVNGCDSINTLTLTVLPAINGGNNAQTICNGTSYHGHTVSGSFSDTLTAASGCDSILSLTLTVLPQPSTAFSRSICQRDTFMGHTTTGLYTDTFTAVSGCDSVVYLNLTVHSLPHVTLYLNFDTVCNNAAQIIMTGGLPAGGYYTGQGIVADSIFDPSIAPIGKDTIYYNFVDSNGCYKNRYEFAHTELCDSTVGIDEATNGLFKVMPNPAMDYLQIENTALQGNCHINLFDVVGRLVATQPATETAITTLRVTQLPAGVYMLQITTAGHKVYSAKIVKE